MNDIAGTCTTVYDFFFYIMNVTSKSFVQLGNTYTKKSITKSANVALQRFKCFFGVTSNVRSIIWEKLSDELPVGAEPKHLLRGLLFLKQYLDEHDRLSTLRRSKDSQKIDNSSETT